MGSKKLVEIFKYTLLIISGLLSHVFTLYTTFNFEFVKAELGGWVAYFGVMIEVLLITTIFFIFYPKYAIGDTKEIEKKGYSKWNNVNIENKVGKTQLKSFLKDNKLGFLLNSPKTGFGSPIDDLVLLDSFQDEIKLMNKSECFSKILKKYGHPKKIYRNLVLYKWMSYFGFLKN